ncbi:MAG TPA: T9SS type A sorting domain-containing protein [Flavipsychrobacter sp.]
MADTRFPYFRRLCNKTAVTVVVVLPFMKTIVSTLLLCCALHCAYAQTFRPVLVADINSVKHDSMTGNAMPSFVAVFKDRLIFSAWDDTTIHLYACDKQERITKYNYNVDSLNMPIYMYPHYAAELGDTLYYTQDFDLLQEERRMYAWDSNDTPRNLLSNRPDIEDPTEPLAIDGKIIFTARNPITWDYSLWQYTPATGNFDNLGTGGYYKTWYKGKLYFARAVGSTGDELYAFDIATRTSTLIFSVPPNPSGTGIYELTVVDDKLFFVVKNADTMQLYSYNGSGTAMQCTDIAGAFGSSYALFRRPFFAHFNGSIYLPVQQGSTASIWAYHIATGTAKEVLTFPFDYTNIGGFIPYRDKLVIGIAQSYHYGLMLFSPQTGAYEVMPPPAGTQIFGSYSPTVFNDRLYFSAYDNLYGWELFRYDDVMRNIPEEITLYPNPATTHTYIRTGSVKEQTLSAVITDVAGRKVYGKLLGTYPAGTHDIEIPLQHVAAGMYILSVYEKNKGKVLTAKLVKL